MAFIISIKTTHQAIWTSIWSSNQTCKATFSRRKSLMRAPRAIKPVNLMACPKGGSSSTPRLPPPCASWTTQVESSSARAALKTYRRSTTTEESRRQGTCKSKKKCRGTRLEVSPMMSKVAQTTIIRFKPILNPKRPFSTRLFPPISTSSSQKLTLRHIRTWCSASWCIRALKMMQPTWLTSFSPVQHSSRT